jgi:hypothetical protein
MDFAARQRSRYYWGSCSLGRCWPNLGLLENQTGLYPVGKSDRQEVVSLALDWVDPFEEGQLSHSFLKCTEIIRSLFPEDPSCR